MPNYGKYIRDKKIIASILLVLLLILSAFFYYQLWKKNKEDNRQNTEKIFGLESSLTEKTEENRLLLEALEKEQKKNTEFQEQINEIAGTVGILDKLSKTDPELLQKYSKVYFLNEHYTPERLSPIDSEYLSSNKKEEEIHSKVLPFLEKMIKAGEEDGVSLRIVSAYRSFQMQSSLKSQYTVVYGSGANKFSADQGYSEHQLGTTVDFTTAQLDTNFSQFGETEAYKWLLLNAYKYGFTLSYPENNSYYQYEPWHWRFVGKDLARKLQRENIHFYDMDQRDIDAFLVDFFD